MIARAMLFALSMILAVVWGFQYSEKYMTLIFLSVWFFGLMVITYKENNKR